MQDTVAISVVCLLATGIFVIVLGSREDTPGSTGCGHGDHSSQVGLEHISKTGDVVALLQERKKLARKRPYNTKTLIDSNENATARYQLGGDKETVQ